MRSIQELALRAAEPRAARPNSAGEPPGRAGRPLRVLCVDDHMILIEGLKARFAVDGGIEIVGRLPSPEGLSEAVERLSPDVVIMDIEMPGPDAFEETDRMRRAFPRVRVVVLSAHIRDAFISASFRAGVSAYFAKSDELSDIVRGIREVAGADSGSFVLGPKVRERCRPLLAPVRYDHGGSTTVERGAQALSGAPKTLLDSLTPREEEILRLIGKGLSRGEIGAQLFRSAKTIDAHQGRMMKKLGLESRADLMRFAIREGLAQA